MHALLTIIVITGNSCPMLRRSLALVAALATAGGSVACAGGGAAGGDGPMQVVAAFYPLQFVAGRVGGGDVQVANLAKPGAEPHDLELTARQAGRLTDAKVIVYLKGFQPAVDDAVSQAGRDRALDVSTTVPMLTAAQEGNTHAEAGDGSEAAGTTDPHVWLDPTRLATIGDAVAARFAEADRSHAATYRANAATLRSQLEALDEEYAAGTRTCQRRELITSHEAFGYLAQRYDLVQVGLSGLTPDAEPSPRRLAEVAREARAHHATTIFFETLVSPKVAETIAQEVGAKAAVLDPIEGLQAGSTADYFSVMHSNLATLRTALGCS
jgi:zinc transport system substrate-binding protein